MSQSRKRIVIVGGSFGGINAAYALRRALQDQAEITVISKDKEFVFVPSLTWVIMGWREPGQLQVPQENVLLRRGIRFVHAEVRDLDPVSREVTTEHERFPYDRYNYRLGGGIGCRSTRARAGRWLYALDFHCRRGPPLSRGTRAGARTGVGPYRCWRSARCKLHRSRLRDCHDDRHDAETGEEEASRQHNLRHPGAVPWPFRRWRNRRLSAARNG